MPSFWQLLLAAAVTGALVELYFLLAMRRRFYSLGIPLFRSRLTPPGARSAPPDVDRLATRLARSIFVPLLFRRFDATEAGFRESLGIRSWFRISYPPLMRGNLRFDATAGSLTVTGFANFWICAVFVYAGKQFFDVRDAGLMVFFVLFTAACYALQAWRFRQVARVAAEEWSATEATELRIDPS